MESTRQEPVVRQPDLLHLLFELWDGGCDDGDADRWDVDVDPDPWAREGSGVGSRDWEADLNAGWEAEE